MLQRILSKFNPTFASLEAEVLKQPFDSDAAKKIINSDKVNINQKNLNDESLLYIALQKNKFKAAAFLIENKIDTTFTNGNNSVLRIAVIKEALIVVETLLQHSKQNINQVDKTHRSLLQDAVMSGNRKIVQLLLDNSIDVNIIDKQNKNVIFDAIGYGDEKIINMILEKDIDLTIVDIDGKTILHDSQVLNNDELAKKLIENGADTTICDKDGNNFLTNVALRGEQGEAILNCAIQNGCNVNTKVANNNSILMEVMFAFSKIKATVTDTKHRDGLKNVATKLLENGLEVDAINDDGETALFDTIRAGDLEACEFLIKFNVKIEHKNNNGETALMVAMYTGISNLNIIKLLLENGANPLTKDKQNRTIPEILNIIILHVHDFKPMDDEDLLEKINSTGNYMVILKEILELEEYEFTYLDSAGDPLYFKSFLSNDIKTCQLYLKAKIDINIKNKDGHTLFYKYILGVFEKDEYIEEFRDKLIFLLVNKANNNIVNKQGQTIYTKVALGPCNLKLFRKLTEVARYDYKLLDSQGRTIMHSCVWSGNLDLLKLVYGVDRNIQNMSDNYGILPITYAAILGNKEISEEFLRRNTIITSGKPIPKAVQDKFSPMLKNLAKLLVDVEDHEMLRKLRILVNQVLRDFGKK